MLVADRMRFRCYEQRKRLISGVLLVLLEAVPSKVGSASFHQEGVFLNPRLERSSEHFSNNRSRSEQQMSS